MVTPNLVGLKYLELNPTWQTKAEEKAFTDGNSDPDMKLSILSAKIFCNFPGLEMLGMSEMKALTFV